MNCIVVDDDDLSREIVQDFIKKHSSLELGGAYDSAIKAYDVLKEDMADILFLDVEMPEMTGMELLDSLEFPPEVILITGKTDYGAEAFNYSVTDYLVKPITYPRFLKAVEKALKNVSQRNTVEQTSDDFIYIKSGKKIIKLNFDEIFFIEALSDYVVFRTERKKYIVHSTMKKIEEKLSKYKFTRVHRSYIVNLSKVSSIEDMEIDILDQQIPIGASYKEDFHKQLNML